jgi:hypothetical protein
VLFAGTYHLTTVRSQLPHWRFHVSGLSHRGGSRCPELSHPRVRASTTGRSLGNVAQHLLCLRLHARLKVRAEWRFSHWKIPGRNHWAPAAGGGVLQACMPCGWQWCCAGVPACRCVWPVPCVSCGAAPSCSCWSWVRRGDVERRHSSLLVVVLLWLLNQGDCSGSSSGGGVSSCLKRPRPSHILLAKLRSGCWLHSMAAGAFHEVHRMPPTRSNVLSQWWCSPVCS